MRVATVARDGARIASCSNGISMPIYIGGIYEAKRRVRDSKLTWRRVGSFGQTTTYISDRWVDGLKAEANSMGINWKEECRHGDEV